MFSIGDLLAIVGLLLTVAGLVFAGYQFWQNARVQRAGFLLEMANRLLAEMPVRNVFEAILAGKFQFNPQHLPPDVQMQALDDLLHEFNLIGRLVNMRVISCKDAQFFRAEAWCVLTKKPVQAYIQWANAQDGTPPGPGGWWPWLPDLVRCLPTAA